MAQSMEKNDWKILMKAAINVTVKTLPDFIKIMGVQGLVVGTFLEKVLDFSEEYTFIKNVKKVEDVEKTCKLISDEIQNGRLSEATMKKKIQEELVKHYKETSSNLVYMNGVILYAYEGNPLDEEEIADIRELFMNSAEDEDYANSLKENVETIRKFLYDYNEQDYLIEQEFTITPTAISIIFGGNLHAKNENDVVEIVEALNEFIGHRVLIEYLIF